MRTDDGLFSEEVDSARRGFGGIWRKSLEGYL
jgi:hypothetical protein